MFLLEKAIKADKNVIQKIKKNKSRFVGNDMSNLYDKAISRSRKVLSVTIVAEVVFLISSFAYSMIRLFMGQSFSEVELVVTGFLIPVFMIALIYMSAHKKKMLEGYSDTAIGKDGIMISGGYVLHTDIRNKVMTIVDCNYWDENNKYTFDIKLENDSYIPNKSRVYIITGVNNKRTLYLYDKDDRLFSEYDDESLFMNEELVDEASEASYGNKVRSQNRNKVSSYNQPPKFKRLGKAISLPCYEALDALKPVHIITSAEKKLYEKNFGEIEKTGLISQVVIFDKFAYRGYEASEMYYYQFEKNAFIKKVATEGFEKVRCEKGCRLLKISSYIADKFIVINDDYVY